MTKVSAYAATSTTSGLAPYQLTRRDPGPHDVQIDILFCGVCHSDIHQVRNEWGGSEYPMVPGHEIVGRVKAIGDQVRKFKVGDMAGVGCLVDSCRDCHSCHDGLEQYCENEFVGTYNSLDKRHNERTFGGYSKGIVVDEKYVLKVSPQLDPARVAPLLCAGITTYSPLKHWKVGPGTKVAVVGLGGLGHMGVKIAKAMGAETTVFTTSAKKHKDAMALGADDVVLWNQPDELQKNQNRFDFILNTVSATHDMAALMGCLKRDGTMTLLGIPEQPPSIHAFHFIVGRKSLAGSLIGGIAETQEMLDFCAKHNVLADIELIPMEKINEAFDRTVKGDVKYRFVIDIAGSL
jgi:uncharacterized zinc-type alcohol dehydrogenase-like protein